jgi:tRNA nucleotidyltransferase/poly(A) polymerase
MMRNKKTINELRAFVRSVLAEAATPQRVRFRMNLPEDLLELHEMMKASGEELYVVGGAVRDVLMDKEPKDYDLTTGASPERVMDILSQDKSLKLDVTGKMFGVVRAWTPEGNEYEIATFRKDIGKGRRPDSVEFTSIDQDVARRDLTVNALFYDIDAGEIVDYVGGIDDLRSKKIRAVGDPALRFDEDKLRILRALRFAARMDSALEKDTLQAILDDNDLWSDPAMSAERITDEFVKGIKSAVRPEYYMELVERTGLLPQILTGLNADPSLAVSSNSVPVQLAFVITDDNQKKITKALDKMRYDRKTIDVANMLKSLSMVNPSTAVKLKKEFKRIGSPSDAVSEFARHGGVPENIASGFLKFASSPPAANPKELMSQGLKGPAIGKAMAAAEEDAYRSLIGESRRKRRSLSGSQPEEGYQKATAEKMFLDAESGGYEDRSKENVLRFLRGLGLMP